MAMRYGYFDSEITGVDSEGMPIFDRAETSELFRLLFSKLLTNGVLAKPADCFKVLAGDNGLSVTVQPGFGLINGAFAYDSAAATFTLAAAPTSYSRIDRVVLRCNYLERLCEIVVKTGTPAASPTAPELIRPVSGDYYELGLALVRVGANQSVITQSAITDTRPDSSVCGYVTQFIDSIDTEVFYDQFDTFYAEFVQKLDASFDQFKRDAAAAYSDFIGSMTVRDENAQQAFDDYARRLTAFEETAKTDFAAWFATIRGILDEETAGNLLNLLQAHTGATVTGETGVHGLRVYDGKLQMQKADGSWEDASASGGLLPQCSLRTEPDATVLCKRVTGQTVLTTVTNQSGFVKFNFPDYGAWIIQVKKEGRDSKSEMIDVDTCMIYRMEIELFTATLEITSEPGATVTASSTVQTYTATVPDTGVVSITIGHSDTYIVSAEKDGKTTESVSVSITTSGETYTAECLFIPTFTAATWDQVAEFSTSGKAKTVWNIGDEKTITANSTQLTFVIMGFDHDELVSGQKAGITIGLKNLMPITRKMNDANTNAGGFPNSDMFAWLQKSVLTALPADLQAVIKTVFKPTSPGNKDVSIIKDAMKLFFFSEQEIFGAKTYSAGNEGTQYSYFATAANRTKYLANGTGSASVWWERSPDASNAGFFCTVSGYGSAGSSSASTNCGICFGFCI